MWSEANEPVTGDNKNMVRKIVEQHREAEIKMCNPVSRLFHVTRVEYFFFFFVWWECERDQRKYVYTGEKLTQAIYSKCINVIEK